MILEHNNKKPVIDKTAYIAPNAVICGDVIIKSNARILFGVQIIAENAPITIGENTIVLENAVIRGTEGHSVRVGNNCLIGPNAHVAGCTIEDNVFLATGSSVFHGSVIQKNSEIRINGVVHIKTILPENSVVPIGWIAIGNPVKILSPDQHKQIWDIQKELNFPEFVYGVDRSDKNIMEEICSVMSNRLTNHKKDKIIKEK